MEVTEEVELEEVLASAGGTERVLPCPGKKPPNDEGAARAAELRLWPRMFWLGTMARLTSSAKLGIVELVRPVTAKK